jgi:aryl-alcohol dehydrogenase
MNDLFFNGTYKDGTHRVHQNGKPVSAFFGQGSFATHCIVDARNAVKVDVGSDEELSKLCSLGCGVQTGAGSVLNCADPSRLLDRRIRVRRRRHGRPDGGKNRRLLKDHRSGRRPVETPDGPGGRRDARGQRQGVRRRRGDQKVTGGGADYSVECTGVPVLILQALGCLRREGKCVLASVTGEAVVASRSSRCL